MNLKIKSSKSIIIKIMTIIIVVTTCVSLFITQTNAGSINNLQIKVKNSWSGADGRGILRLYKSANSSNSNVIARINVNNCSQGSITMNVIDQINNYTMVQVESAKYKNPWIYIGAGSGAVDGRNYNFINNKKNYPIVTGNSKNWTWPAPNCRVVTSKFGPRGGKWHDGVDISKSGGSHGEKIVATKAGKVTLSTYSKSAGHWIVINHNNGLSSIYMHCSSRLVKAGDYVNQGQKIGLIGNTGNSRGAHLHFGISKSATALSLSRQSSNPLNYIWQS